MTGRRPPPKKKTKIRSIAKQTARKKAGSPGAPKKKKAAPPEETAAAAKTPSGQKRNATKRQTVSRNAPKKTKPKKESAAPSAVSFVPEDTTARLGDNRDVSKTPGKHVFVKKKSKFTHSSRQWLERQLNDPYVKEARRLGLRSRAAFKLSEIDDELQFLKPGMSVVDLGAAPGGWTQVVASRTKPLEHGGRIVAIDFLDMAPVDGTVVLKHDFTADDAPGLLKDALGGEADVVLSDMAWPTTGHKQTDHLRIIALLEMAYEFALEVLKPGGVFLAKVFQGGSVNDVLGRMKQDFEKVKHIKPKSSRKDSAEIYVVALGYRRQEDTPE